MAQYILALEILRAGNVRQFQTHFHGAESLLLHRYDEFVHNVILPLGRVLAHVEIEGQTGLGARHAARMRARLRFFTALSRSVLLDRQFTTANESEPGTRIKSSHPGFEPPCCC